MKTLLRLMGIAIAISCALAAYGGDFSGRDTADVREVLDAYVAAWLSGNQEAVMRLLTPDSVLIPGEKAPFIGRAAIRGYWTPAGSPPFALRRFTTTLDQITGSSGLATVRGTQVIEWTSGKERWRTRGNYLTVLRKTSAGWRIAIQMAANAPSERIP